MGDEEASQLEEDKEAECGTGSADPPSVKIAVQRIRVWMTRVK